MEALVGPLLVVGVILLFAFLDPLMEGTDWLLKKLFRRKK